MGHGSKVRLQLDEERGRALHTSVHQWRRVAEQEYGRLNIVEIVCGLFKSRRFLKFECNN